MIVVNVHDGVPLYPGADPIGADQFSWIPIVDSGRCSSLLLIEHKALREYLRSWNLTCAKVRSAQREAIGDIGFCSRKMSYE